MTYDELNRVNELLDEIDVKGSGYVMVKDRVMGFRRLFPEGTIETEIVSINDGVCIVKATASVMVDGVKRVLGTGYSYEKENSTFINKTSYIENCETSAIGRALGAVGIGIRKSYASKDEISMAEAQRKNNAASRGSTNPTSAGTNANTGTKITQDMRNSLYAALDKAGKSAGEVVGRYNLHNINELTVSQYKEFMQSIS